MKKIKLRVGAPYVQYHRYTSEFVISFNEDSEFLIEDDAGDLGEFDCDLADYIQSAYFDSKPDVDSDFEFDNSSELEDWDYEVIEVIDE